MDTKEIIRQHEKRDDELKDMMRGRFVDYDSNFKAIDKRFENHEELMKINGEHLSHIRKDLSNLVDSFNKHKDLVEPILENFNDNKAFWRVMKKWGANIAIITGLAGGYYFLRELFK